MDSGFVCKEARVSPTPDLTLSPGYPAFLIVRPENSSLIVASQGYPLLRWHHHTLQIAVCAKQTFAASASTFWQLQHYKVRCVSPQDSAWIHCGQTHPVSSDRQRVMQGSGGCRAQSQLHLEGQEAGGSDAATLSTSIGSGWGRPASWCDSDTEYRKVETGERVLLLKRRAWIVQQMQLSCFSPRTESRLTSL